MTEEKIVGLISDMESDWIERTRSTADDKLGSDISDLSIELFKFNYLPFAIDKDTLAENGRTTEEQLASLRFYDTKEKCPSHAGILVFG